MKLNGGCATDIGNVRKVNQDAIFFRFLKKKDQYFALGVVCDGIGGLAYGEVASDQVIRAVHVWFSEVSRWIDIETAVPDVLFAHLKDAAEEWNRLVRERIVCGHCQMGTTMSALMIIRDRYYIIQIGDSRVYLYRDDLWQLTTDAVVSRMKNGEMKQYLSNYIGRDDELWFTTAEGVVRDGDLFLYGSDGFYHFLTREDAAWLYRSGLPKRDPDGAGRKLIEIMRKRGEQDNISAGVIFVHGGSGLFRRKD